MCEKERTELTEGQHRAIRAELDRLLESSAFRNSKRCREFLEHIVRLTIAGPAGALKERLIGVELFQLPQDFDTGQRTIVRVTANEVRKKLAQHYLAQNGAFHQVRIELHTGSYSAEFKWDTPAVEKPVEEAPAAEKPPAEIPIPADVHKRATLAMWPTFVVVGTAAFLVVCALLLWKGRAAKSATADVRSAPASVGAAAQTGSDLRVIVGSTSSFFDRSGRTWGQDRFFSGGAVAPRTPQRILRTLDPDLYQHPRSGEFRYDIPLGPGLYELHLHFAETGLADFISAESSGEGQRVFRVAANGKTILDAFDVVADAAGANISDERVFREISPGQDGLLHLTFSSIRGAAMVNGIEVLPIAAGRVRPIRIRAGLTSVWRDPEGKQWQADSYFMGGNALVRTTNPAQNSTSNAPGREVYSSERWGHFSYALPLADGRYKVTLRFCEGHYGKRNSGVGGVGSRLFDLYCNGVALLRNFDAFKEAGGEGGPIDQSFSGIRPNAQGKILLTFVPVNGMAFVNGIEVEEELK
jgi:hypothetical protein